MSVMQTMTTAREKVTIEYPDFYPPTNQSCLYTDVKVSHRTSLQCLNCDHNYLLNEKCRRTMNHTK